MYLRAVGGKKDCHHERASSESELHGDGHSGELERYASYENAEEDADEHGYQVGFVESLH